MPKPKRVDRPVSKHLHFPESTASKVELLLYSELEERVPHGAWQKFITGLIEEHFEKRARHAQALGAVAMAQIEHAGDPEAYGAVCRRLSDSLLEREGYSKLVEKMYEAKRGWA